MWSKTEGRNLLDTVAGAAATLQDFEGLESYSRGSPVVPVSDGGIKNVPGRGGNMMEGLHTQGNTGQSRQSSVYEALEMSRN